MANSIDVKGDVERGDPFDESATDLLGGVEFQLVERDRDPRRTANRLRSRLEAKKVAKLASVQAQLAKVDEEAARLDAEKERAKAELARIQAMIAAKYGTERQTLTDVHNLDPEDQFVPILNKGKQPLVEEAGDPDPTKPPTKPPKKKKRKNKGKPPSDVAAATPATPVDGLTDDILAPPVLTDDPDPTKPPTKPPKKKKRKNKGKPPSDVAAATPATPAEDLVGLSTPADDQVGPSTPADDLLGPLPPAWMQFQSGQFNQCLMALDACLKTKPDDVHIDHNIGLAKFFGDGCTDPKRLLDLLNDVKKRSEELARASAEPEESVCMEKLTSVATFNIAVIWFHLHEYAKALSVVEPLFQNSGSIDEEIALNSCLLLRDVLLACHDATKSADVLLYLENLLLHLKDGLPTVASILGPNALANAFSDIDPLRSGYLELKMLLYKVQFFLLTKNLKQAEHNLKHATSISTRKRDLSMVTFLKSQLAYASGKYPGAIIMLNYLRDINKEDTRIQSMINNNLGCVYYKWGKYHASSIFFSKALKFCSPLRKDRPLNCTTIPPDNSLLIVYNCGMQYLARGKPLQAAHCFRKAGLIFYNRPLYWLRFSECCLMAMEKGLLETSPATSDVSVRVIGKGKWRQLVVEGGVSKNGNSGSFERGDIFLGSDQPKLSMSLARQCLSNALYLLGFSDSSICKNSLPSNAFLDDKELDEGASSENSNHNKLPNIHSKEFVLSIGKGQVIENGEAKEQKGGTTQELVQNSLSYYEGIGKRENLLLKQAVLANMAYVELELENPLKALSRAESLLKLAECSKIYIFLGHVYAAEALCLLNRPNDAADHLMTYLSGVDVELPFSEEDSEQLQRTADYEDLNGGSATVKNSFSDNTSGIVFLKPEEARAALCVNFATMYAIQGDLDQARQFVAQALSIVPNSPEATLTAVYVELKLGNSQEALTMLKQCSRITFLPSQIDIG